MSLRPDDKHHRARSKSPGRTRERSRSRSHVDDGPAFAADPRLSGSSLATAQPPSPSTPQYEVRQPGLSSYITPGQQQSTPTSEDMDGFTMGGYADLPPHERPGYGPPSSPGAQQPPMQYAQPSQWNYSATPVNSAPPQQPARTAQGGYQQQAGYPYAQPEGLKYTSKPVTAQQAAQRPPQILHRNSSSSSNPAASFMAMPSPHQFIPPPPPGAPPKKAEKYDPHLAYGVDNARVVEVKPGGGSFGAPPSPRPQPHRLSVHEPRPDLRAPPSPGLVPRMDRLSVTGNRPDPHNIMPGAFPGGGGGIPPASPLLEAYHGTYQSLSPMPSPMMLPRDDDLDELPPLELRLSAEDKRGSKKHGRHRSSSSVSHGQSSSLSVNTGRKDKDRDRSRSRAREDRREKEKEKGKRVKIYDAEDDANSISKALASRDPDADVLIDILPALSHDQLMELRSEYKRICKVQGRGVNLAKHIKMKLPSSSNFGKIVHITALGRWESEGYWANYWYQGNSSKRELLIEALMGRSNFEIREICDAFKDKRYGDDLVRCMETELKKDKFRLAVLMALEAERQEESDVWPLEYRNRDVDAMAHAVRAREGGETDILRIVCTRSDEHLRECLKVYERKYQANFAREVLRRSNNLVGEVCAHILNGVINKPARDAMLLHHALSDLMDRVSGIDPSSSSAKHERQHRYELLISRLVRLHWDRLHLRRVKQDYREKYDRHLEEDIEDATKGDFRDFCIALCDMGVGVGR